MLVRKCLIDEGKDENGLPDGSIFLLSSVPGDWLKEGKEIKLTGFPTVYGTFDFVIKSSISSKREIHVTYHYRKSLGKDQVTGRVMPAWNTADKLYIRLVPSAEDRGKGRKLQDQASFTRYDEWTIQVPIKEKGDFVARF